MRVLSFYTWLFLGVILAVLLPKAHAWKCPYCDSENSQYRTSCDNCTKPRPTDEATYKGIKVVQGMEKKLEAAMPKLAGAFGTGDKLVDQKLAELTMMSHCANKLGQLVMDASWLDRRSTAMAVVTGGVSHFVPRATETSASPSGATDHFESMKKAYEQFDKALNEKGKTVCRRGELCDHGNSQPENVLHIEDSQVAQAIMLALVWIQLHEGDLVSATLQALGQLTASEIDQTNIELLTFLQQYQPEDLMVDYDAEGIIGYALDTMHNRQVSHISLQIQPQVFITLIKDTATDTYTWVVGAIMERGVRKKRLLEVIKHILNFKPAIIAKECCVM